MYIYVYVYLYVEVCICIYVYEYNTCIFIYVYIHFPGSALIMCTYNLFYCFDVIHDIMYILKIPGELGGFYRDLGSKICNFNAYLWHILYL